MAIIKHLGGKRVKLVKDNGKQCEGCCFDKGVGNKCSVFWQCFDFISCEQTMGFGRKTTACHWEIANK